jgi:hypothetical protein
MPSDDFDKTFQMIVESLGQAQAINHANSYILMEVVRNLARASTDPHRYLANMFERVSARADQGPIEREAHPINVEFRDAISCFFANAEKGLKG